MAGKPAVARSFCTGGRSSSFEAMIDTARIRALTQRKGLHARFVFSLRFARDTYASMREWSQTRLTAAYDRLIKGGWITKIAEKYKSIEWCFTSLARRKALAQALKDAEKVEGMRTTIAQVAQAQQHIDALPDHNGGPAGTPQSLSPYCQHGYEKQEPGDECPVCLGEGALVFAGDVESDHDPFDQEE
jgi:hypothetical protein